MVVMLWKMGFKSLHEVILAVNVIVAVNSESDIFIDF